MSQKLEAEITKLEEELNNNDELPYAIQVKEKYGTLRFYIRRQTDVMSAAIDEAEARSAVICEKCGQPGKLRTNDWITVRCDEHATNA